MIWGVTKGCPDRLLQLQTKGKEEPVLGLAAQRNWCWGKEWSFPRSVGVGRAILPELEHKEDVFKTSFKTSSAFTMREKETPTHIYIIRIIEYNFGCDNCNTCVLSRPSGSKRGCGLQCVWNNEARRDWATCLRSQQKSQMLILKKQN